MVFGLQGSWATELWDFRVWGLTVLGLVVFMLSSRFRVLGFAFTGLGVGAQV